MTFVIKKIENRSVIDLLRILHRVAVRKGTYNAKVKLVVLVRKIGILSCGTIKV